ncbi:hypothetical protein AN960_13555 [Bacillus sp. FJAT-25509]|uniref:hypothetical protein n=1 Tax=Bacillaceae TaxID=186817 RepID=UPI0006F667E5|nr:hypothetical protein [Bacillus sp. FJAT-25509]KQL37990.1 hypothetical protein AN960_13555 [Bacillus sp. FJAT-25509]
MKKRFLLLAIFVFLVSCNREVTSNHLTTSGRSIVESYNMTNSEKNVIKRIGENPDQIALFKLNFGNVNQLKEIKVKVKVYEDGKLIQTISDSGIYITKNDIGKPFYLSFQRKLQLETERTYEWNTTISQSAKTSSTVQTVYKQPQMTNVSTIGTIFKKQEIKKDKEIILGAFIDAVDRMETVEVFPDIQDNERLFKNKYVYLLCLEVK